MRMRTKVFALKTCTGTSPLERLTCVLTLNILVLFLSLYCSVLCKFYCFLVFTLRSDITSVYSLLCLMNHCLTSGCEFCIMYSETLEKCVFFFSAKVTEMPSVLSAKLLCRVSAKLKKKLTLCFLLLLRILNYSICSLTLIICLLSTFFSLSLSLFLSFSFDCTNTIADLILLACYLLAVSVLGHQTL